MLTAAQKAFFVENGYLKLDGVIPPADCRAVIDAAFEFLEMNPSDPDDWYRPPLTPGGMIEMYQHPALWANRQSEALYEAFTDLQGTPHLWVSIDRANFKVPLRHDKPEWANAGFLHVDADINQPIAWGLQGVLYLADTDETQGGFKCLPGWHMKTPEWVRIAKLPKEEFDREVAGLPVQPIPGKAGDFVIWHRALPHGNGLNRSSRPRFAQFITMFKAGGPGPARDDRVRRWRERLAPEAAWVVGDPRRWEARHGRTADLSPLGRKLLGLDAWT
jgi:hypothetical protein